MFTYALSLCTLDVSDWTFGADSIAASRTLEPKLRANQINPVPNIFGAGPVPSFR